MCKSLAVSKGAGHTIVPVSVQAWIMDKRLCCNHGLAETLISSYTETAKAAVASVLPLKRIGAAKANRQESKLVTGRMSTYRWRRLESLHRCVSDIPCKGTLWQADLHDRKSSVLQSPQVGGRGPEPALRKAQVYMCVLGFLQVPESRGRGGESGLLNRKMSMQLCRVLQQLLRCHTWHQLSTD